MSRMKLFALEDEMIGGVDETTGSESAAAAAVAEEVETESNSIEETASSVTDGIEATQELGEVKDVMDQSVEVGTGLDPVAAEMARISIRNILSKIGAESYANTLMVASESFGSTSSRLANTRYASEGVGEFIANIWEKIKIFFSNMWNKIRDFIVGLFNKEKAIKDAVKRVEKKLDSAELSGKKKNIPTKGKLGGFVFNQRKKLTTYSDMVNFIDAQQKEVDDLAEISANLLSSSEKLLEFVIEEKGNVLKSVKGGLGDSIPEPRKAGPFYGGYTVEIEWESNDYYERKNVTAAKALNVIGGVDSLHFKSEEFELVGDTGSLKTLMGKITKFIDGKASSKKEGKIIQDKIDNIMKSIKKHTPDLKISTSTSSDGSTTPSDQREMIYRMIKDAKKGTAITSTAYSFITSTNFKLAAAAIYYAEVCMFENSDYYVSKTEKDD